MEVARLTLAPAAGRRSALLRLIACTARTDPQSDQGATNHFHRGVVGALGGIETGDSVPLAIITCDWGTRELGRHPSNEEIAEHLGVTPGKAAEIMVTAELPGLLSGEDVFAHIHLWDESQT